MGLHNVCKVLKTMNLRKAYKTYSAIRKTYGIRKAHKAIRNKFKGRRLLEGIDDANYFSIDLGLSQESSTGSQVYDYRGNEIFEAHQSSKKDDEKVLNLGVKFSIVVPIYNPDIECLKLFIDSVEKQIYQNYELVLVDDGSKKREHVGYLEELASHEKIKVILNEKNQGIAGATNDGVKSCSGDYVIFCDQDDEMTLDALYWFAKELKNDSSLDWIYSDECKITPDGKMKYDFYYKPDFSLSLLLSQMYTGHLTAYRKTLIEKAGYLRAEYNFSQDYDLALRISKLTNKIKHIGRVLYFWRALPSSGASGGKDFARVSNLNALRDYFFQNGIKGNPLPKPGCNYFQWTRQTNPLVSLIIPSDSVKNLRECIPEILNKTTYPNYEIVIVSKTVVLAEIISEFEQYKNIVPCHFNEPFNFSRKCNKGAETANGEYICLYNDDVLPISPDWIEKMLDKFAEPNVGSVSPLCVDLNNKVQFAGMMSSVPGIITTSFNGNPAFAPENCLFNHILPRDISILSGACCLILKKAFTEAKGFDEINTPNGHSDIVLAYRLAKLGYRNVYNPISVVKHIGNHTWHKKKEADKCDIFLFREWADYMYDPYFTTTQISAYNPAYEKTNFKFYKADCIANKGSKKDILFVTHELTRSGAPLVMIDAIKVALSKGLFVTVYSLVDGPLSANLNELGVNVIVDNSLNLYPEAFKRFAINFDTVWVNTIAVGNAITELNDELPNVIWWVHEGTKALEIFKDCMPSKIGKNIHIYVCSEYTKKIFKKYFTATVLAPGAKQMRTENKSSDDTKIRFGIVGAMEERKGQDILVKAIEMLPQCIKGQIEFIFSSRDCEAKYEKIRQKIMKSPNCSLIESIDSKEMATFYSNLDAMIVPSRDEPLSLIVLEAMSIGKPTIASTNVGAVQFMIKQDKKSLVFKNECAEQLAKCIETYVIKKGEFDLESKERIKIFEDELSIDVFDKKCGELLDYVTNLPPYLVGEENTKSNRSK